MNSQETQGKVKKPFYKKVWFWVVVVLVVGIAACSGGSSNEEPKKTGSVETEKKQEDTSSADVETETEEAEEAEAETDQQEPVEEEPVDNTFAVGDIVETDDLKISFLSAEEYVSDNQFMQPADGKVYYRMEFEFENIGNTDQSVSSMLDWNCYADSYAADQTWVGEDTLDATISPGKKAKGAIYYEVPADAAEITLEYETSFWTEDKIIFVVK